MPLAFHGDRDTLFEQQLKNAANHVLPFVSQHMTVKGASVVDIGCGEGGVLKAFLDAGAAGVGVDLNASRVEYARDQLSAEIDAGRATLVAGDIHEISLTDQEPSGPFDLVVLKDAIEHIPEKHRLLLRIKELLTSDGIVFIGFPPWRMPYGGHQQITNSWIGKLPYLHLLPKREYLPFLRLIGENDSTIAELDEIYDTRVSINSFERLVRQTGFHVLERRLYLLNPIYELKFGLKGREQLPVLRSLPWLRDFLTTACYYAVKQA